MQFVKKVETHNCCLPLLTKKAHRVPGSRQTSCKASVERKDAAVHSLAFRDHFSAEGGGRIISNLIKASELLVSHLVSVLNASMPKTVRVRVHAKIQTYSNPAGFKGPILMFSI